MGVLFSSGQIFCSPLPSPDILRIEEGQDGNGLTGGDATNSAGQGGKTALQRVPVEPANITRLEGVSGEAGELGEAVRLGQVGVMTAWRWGSVAGVEM